MKKRKNRYALLMIDFINDFNFPKGDLLARHTAAICPSLIKLKSFCRRKGIPIIYVNDHYGIWKADLEEIIEYTQNERSAYIIQQLKPAQEDYFLIKPKHSAFYGTGLHTLLNELGADTLIITGIAGNICVFFTANDAYMREYQLYIPEDGIASETEKENQYALHMMRNILNAQTETIERFIESDPEG
ncbi:isochorismatase family cysteine hydrolase [Bacillus xiapuensis]|uniref:isochorismatase family cysteine hydrolase n=1 Tax=Bacillus xiapuensis TaxID=2014075 RepID=UPI000C243036|nr:isochorismatase family cysteine hydrolase [Bacillus xiapuensis]